MSYISGFDEWNNSIVENEYEALQLSRDGKIQLVGHNLSHDQIILENCFQFYGFPFYWEDKNHINSNGKEGLFEHLGHDTLQIGQAFKVYLHKKKKFSSATLYDIAKSFGIDVYESELHSSRYDC